MTPKTDCEIFRAYVHDSVRSVEIEVVNVAFARRLETSLIAEQQKSASAYLRAVEAEQALRDAQIETDRLKRQVQAHSTYRAFWDKYALGPLAAPSCLSCGQRLTEPPAVQHMEIPGIVICKTCKALRDAKPVAKKPQQIAQKVKAGRGWMIVRNSATLATTDYERVADEIVASLNAAAPQQSEPVREADKVIMHAYALLWSSITDAPRINMARRELRNALSPQQQADAILAIGKEFPGLVSQMEADTLALPLDAIQGDSNK